LFFHADWCPTCVAAEKDILSKDIPSDLTILKVNFDSEIELKKKYEIIAQTTFIQIDNK
jgi:thioredoxin 1